MADSAVPITAGTGTNIDTQTQASGDHRQVIVVGDAVNSFMQKVNSGGDAVVSFTHPSLASMGIFGGVTAYGNVRVTSEATGLFNDPFDTTAGLDTTTRWTTVGTAPTLVTGAAQLQANGTASASSALISRPTFGSLGVNFLGVGFIARFENNGSVAGTAFSTNTHRFMGMGTPPTTWSTAYSASATTGPALNAIGFEIDTDGLMYPVLYDNGTRTRPALNDGSANLNVNRALANGQSHQFLIVIRADAIFWYVDGTNAPVAMHTFATTGFSAPDSSTLPLRFAQINSATAVSGATPLFRVGAVGVGDTGGTNQTLSDPVFPWRRAGVTVPAEQFVNANVGGNQGNAINTNPNAIQKATYLAADTTSNTMTAATAKAVISLSHAASSTRTVRIRRILLGFQNGTATASNVFAEIRRGTAAATAGTVRTAQPTHPATPASDTVITGGGGVAIVAATIMHTQHYGTIAASGSAATQVIYDWQESGETIPLTLRAGNLDSISIWVTSSAAITLTPYVTVFYTEE